MRDGDFCLRIAEVVRMVHRRGTAVETLACTARNEKPRRNDQLKAALLVPSGGSLQRELTSRSTCSTTFSIAHISRASRARTDVKVRDTLIGGPSSPAIGSLGGGAADSVSLLDDVSSSDETSSAPAVWLMLEG